MLPFVMAFVGSETDEKGDQMGTDGSHSAHSEFLVPRKSRGARLKTYWLIETAAS